LGIKGFGLIQLLLKNNQLNSRTLLIIDEPEIHLHPNWQVLYAEILVLLSKKLEIPILLTSHSPYFIEALKLFRKI
jgi:predicted ATP-dependent endonuclease of OLD family